MADTSNIPVIATLYTGLDFRKKKPCGQLAPKLLDLVASTNFLVAKKFSAIRDENIYLKNLQYKQSTPPSLQREGKKKKKNHT